MKKRFYCLFLACLLMLAFTGCNKKTETATEASETSESAANVETVETTEEAKKADPADAFKPFEDPKGAFTAAFPGTPEESVQMVPAAGTSVELYSYYLELSDTAYNVTYSDYPEGSVTDPAAVLESALTGVSYPIEESKDIMLGNYAGKEVKYSGQSGSDTITFYQRVYVVGDRMYQLQAMNTTGERNPEVDVFFDSFALSE